MSIATPEPVVLDYPDYVARLRGQDAALAEALAGFHGVEDVLHWMEQCGLCRQKQTIDLVGQDEFSYDFLLELEPGGNWLVFGVTWLGSLTAVAVWTDKPTPDELLAWRLEGGWRPTLSRLQAGAAVTGHAACLTRSVA